MLLIFTENHLILLILFHRNCYLSIFTYLHRHIHIHIVNIVKEIEKVNIVKEIKFFYEQRPKVEHKTCVILFLFFFSTACLPGDNLSYDE